MIISGKRNSVPRCRQCANFGSVNIYGHVCKEDEYSTCCQYWRTKFGYYKSHKPSQRACEYFDHKVKV